MTLHTADTTQEQHTAADLDSEMHQCSECSAQAHIDDITTDIDGELYCQDCADDVLVTTEDGETIRADQSISTENEEIYHENNPYIVTATNGRFYHRRRDDVLRLDTGWRAGDYSHVDDCFTCDSCSNTMDNDHYHSDGYCQDCYQEEENADSIKPYSTDVLDYYKLLAPSKSEHFQHTIGVELEAEGIRHTCDEIDDEYEGFIFKEDGSLDNGAELVTRPAPYSWHESFFSSGILEAMRDAGGRSYNTTTCGLHVHIGRAYLTQLQIARAIVFLHNPENETFLRAIAQRDPSRWARIALGKTLCKQDTTRNGDEGRYTSLNLENAKTVELRIFKGTLSRTGVMRAIQFTLALFESQRTGNAESITQCHRLETLLDHITKNAKHYKDLALWLEAKQWTIDGKVNADKMPSRTFKPFIAGREGEATRQRKIEQRTEAANAELARLNSEGEAYYFNEDSRTAMTETLDLSHDHRPDVLTITRNGDITPDRLVMVQFYQYDSAPIYLQSTGWRAGHSVVLLPVEQQRQTVQDYFVNELCKLLARLMPRDTSKTGSITITDINQVSLGNTVIMSAEGVRRYMISNNNPTDLTGKVTHISRTGESHPITVQWANGNTNHYAMGTLILVQENTPQDDDGVFVRLIRQTLENQA